MASPRYQPRSIARIDRANALGAKVIECFPLNGSYVTASGKLFNIGGGASRGLSPRGGHSLRGSGSSARASASLNLAAHSKITVAFWLYWDSYANTDNFALEFTNGFNTGANGFYFNPNSSSPSGVFAITAYNTGTGGANGGYFSRPSAGEWHRILVTIERNASSALCCAVYVDGVQQTVTQNLFGSLTGNFANSTLHLLSRNGASLYGTGNLELLTVYAGALTAAEAAEDFRNPYQVFAEPEEEDEPAPSGDGGISATLNATLAPATLAATAALASTAGLAASLAPATLTAAGALPIAGSLSKQLDPATLVATAVVADEPSGGDGISASLNAQLAPATLAASGALTIRPALATTLQDTTLAASGQLATVAGLSRSLDDVALAAHASSPVVAQLAATLADATLVARMRSVVLDTLPAPSSRTMYVSAEPRSFFVPADAMTYSEPEEPRTIQA
jgi:hypothetical protein